MILLTAVASMAFGIVIGSLMNYLIETKPLLEMYNKLVYATYKMKRRGFVPQFDIEQRQDQDLGADIREY